MRTADVNFANLANTRQPTTAIQNEELHIWHAASDGINRFLRARSGFV